MLGSHPNLPYQHLIQYSKTTRLVREISQETHKDITTMPDPGSQVYKDTMLLKVYHHSYRRTRQSKTL
jgi:hypothetical protein